MKGFIKKFITTCIMVMMIFTTITPLMAQEKTLNQQTTAQTATASITIDQLEANSKVYLYQVIEGSFDGQGNLIDYLWNQNVAQYMIDNYQSYIDKNNNAVTNEFKAVSDTNGQFDQNDTMANLANKLAIDLKHRNVVATKTLENTAGTSVTFDNLHVGSYVIYIENQNTKYIHRPLFVSLKPELDGTSGNVVINSKTINIKKDEVSLTKTSDITDVYSGQEVTFTLTFKVPAYINSNQNKTVILTDTLPQGLDLLKDSIKISLVNSNGILANEFNIDTTSINNGFKVTLNDYDALNTKLDVSREMKIEYKAKVNNNAYTKDSLVNKADYTYNKYQYANENATLTSNVQLNIYELIINKVAYDGKNIVSPNGAQFEIYKDNGSNNLELISFVKTDNNKYYYDATKDPQYITRLEVNCNVDKTSSSIEIVGLPSAKYIVKEVVAPQAFGFAVPQNPNTNVTFNYANNALDINNTVSGTNVKKNADGKTAEVTINGNQMSFTIENFKGEFNIPNTGSIGTTIFTVGGLLIMAASLVAMVVIYTKRKHS